MSWILTYNNTDNMDMTFGMFALFQKFFVFISDNLTMVLHYLML